MDSAIAVFWHKCNTKGQRSTAFPTQALKEHNRFPNQQERPPKELAFLFFKSLQVNNYPRVNLGLPTLHSPFGTAGSCGATVKLFLFSEGAAHPDNSPVYPPSTALALWLALED